MRIARGLALALALAAGVVGVWRGTWAVGGSDSSCYALMAKAFARGELQPSSPLAVTAPWPDRQTTVAPGGFIASPVRPDAASPVCAPGFSALLAPLYFIGGADAIFLLTPLAGALLVYLTFVCGRQLAGDLVGLAAAASVATAPVFVFQIVQPMNDVTVATIWTALVVLAARPKDHSAWIGALTGIALLVRPNLAPGAIVVGAWCLAGGFRRFIAFASAATPFILLLLALNAALYGHPFRTGYGATADLFSTGYLVANLQNYGRALVQTQLGLPLIGFAAAFVVPREQRRFTLFALTIASTVIVVYLLYRPLPEWWYLRFLLPALPTLTVLAMATVAFASRRTAVVVPLGVVAIVYATTSSAMKDAWDLARLEHRFRSAGAVARERLPETAVFITVWESGSVRYHADREAVLWDSLDQTALDSALVWLASRDREPYIMIEDWEESLFRARFAQHSAVGQLDWPPQFEIERRVKIYRPSDRPRYLNGESVPTEFVWPNRR